MKRDGNEKFGPGNYRFHDWIKRSLSENVPYDRFVRSILTASGPPEASPPVVWYRHLKTPESAVDETAQVFLGMRLQCARCHHHPFETWSQDDYFGFAAFFARVGKKPSPAGTMAGRSDEIVYFRPGGAVRHPKTNAVMAPKPPGSPAPDDDPDDDPRTALTGWLTEPSNPFFARALVNRYWSHFFGRGLYEPIDDLRASNPPTDPELLDALADRFAKGGYDLKALIRTIATSRVYGLSSVPNEANAADRQGFARHDPRRMPAEVLLDAVAAVTESPSEFRSMPKGTRAIDLPDEAVSNSFLDAFGRPKRDTACECERLTDASLAQSLVLMNSQDVHQKLARPAGRADRLAKDPRPAAEKIDEVFLAAFGRLPSPTEKAASEAHVASKTTPQDVKRAYEDILWALMNAREFQFND